MMRDYTVLHINRDTSSEYWSVVPRVVFEPEIARCDNEELANRIAVGQNVLKRLIEYKKNVRAMKCDCELHSPNYDCPNCRFNLVMEQAGIDTLLDELTKEDDIADDHPVLKAFDQRGSHSRT